MEFCKQDMPPPGGYKPLSFKKVPCKTWSPYTKFAILMGVVGVALWDYYRCKREKLFEDIRTRCSKSALIPLMEAESDRAKLKYLKKVRAEEERIMKDVPGWEVGTWKGFPVYFSVDANEYYEPSLFEVYKHTDLSAPAEITVSNKIFF